MTSGVCRDGEKEGSDLDGSETGQLWAGKKGSEMGEGAEIDTAGLTNHKRRKVSLE